MGPPCAIFSPPPGWSFRFCLAWRGLFLRYQRPGAWWPVPPLRPSPLVEPCFSWRGPSARSCLSFSSPLLRGFMDQPCYLKKPQLVPCFRDCVLPQLSPARATWPLASLCARPSFSTLDNPGLTTRSNDTFSLSCPSCLPLELVFEKPFTPLWMPFVPFVPWRPPGLCK